MSLHELLDFIAAQSPIAELVAAIHGSKHLRVAPLMGAARTPVVAALVRGADSNGPSLGAGAEGPPKNEAATEGLPCVLFVVGNGDGALRAGEDLRQWLAPEQVLVYPASDAMPYEQMSPGSDVLGQRLRVLQRLTEGRPRTKDRGPKSANSDDDSSSAIGLPSLVVVASVKALLQPTLTPEELAQATTTLRRGQELSQDELIRRWIALGYRVGPTVEEPGELNRRGGIVDIWPMGDDRPLRIEWFGDEIDSIRRFDAASQRSEQRLASASIGPPHEIPFWRRAEALEVLHAVDVSSMRPEALTQWEASVARLEEGERFEGRAFFAPFFREPTEDRRRKTEDSNRNGSLSFVPRPSSLLAHLPAAAAVLFSEEGLLAQTAAELVHQAEEQRAALTLAGELPTDFPRPYLYWSELLAAAQVPLVDLSNNELEIGDRRLETEGQSNTTQFSLPDSFFLPAELFGGQMRRLVADIVTRLRAGERVGVVTPQAARIKELVEESWTEGRRQKAESSEPEQGATIASQQPSAFSAVHGTLDAGWRSPEMGLTLYTDSEIFGLRQRRPVAERRRQKEKTATERAAFLRGLKVGDYVVHIEHGIAVYEGLLRRSLDNVEREYLVLRYAAGDKLYVPVDQVDRVSRYIGAGEAEPQLTRLGTQEWERAKRKVRQAVRDLADELLAIYAARQLSEGHAFSPDNEWQRELEGAFPYVETPDQLRALDEVKHDMETIQPMDRLLCGDVGFGKTEVALRAAFKAVQDGKQVAILVPTTVLAQQHYDTFRQRMEAFPVTVEMLSRFRSPKEQDVILASLAKGGVDIIIGTHRILSKDVHFKDLGLVIVDEEQRFGVRHKERLKQLRAQVDVLTLTATPIPRTLHMSLAGIRDLSVIDTPPEDRVPIKTYVLPSEDNLIREAILREMDRGGQVYFVHNRVHSIYHVASHIQKLVPEATIGVGHGQLDERQLEKVMLEFFSGKYDVLVCTTIIESGLDVPSANTIIIDDATNYGLAQLYQLRGRVGRSANRAYAYLLYKPDRAMTEEAQQRLEAIQEATELGAGFRIAMRDLEIRGAGNLLGPEQSGHIAAVGFDLYSRLLEQAVKDMKARFDQAGRPEMGDGRPETDDPQKTIDGQTSSQNGTTRRTSSVAGLRSPVIDEKVLVNPLVTLDLPLTAFLPPEYIFDDAVRLSVYQRMGEAQTPSEVRALRQELRDRFGEPPEPAEHLLTWLMIKSLALRAGVSSVLTTGEEFIVRLPERGNVVDREKLRRRFGRDTTVKVGPQFVRLDRRSLNGNWVEKLEGVLEVLGRDG